jgi:hypothetical protein
MQACFDTDFHYLQNFGIPVVVQYKVELGRSTDLLICCGRDVEQDAVETELD